ncbi:hypothetical protein V6N12_032120 [Hibiscus sabdariffa]|uniref:Uncharacterized protein n=1 Tax=Hibiscus sabdariffa TaxID=183260 RepID=A0ABR2CBN9_9ROSI
MSESWKKNKSNYTVEKSNLSLRCLCSPLKLCYPDLNEFKKHCSIHSFLQIGKQERFSLLDFGLLASKFPGNPCYIRQLSAF